VSFERSFRVHLEWCSQVELACWYRMGTRVFRDMTVHHIKVQLASALLALGSNPPIRNIHPMSDAEGNSLTTSEDTTCLHQDGALTCIFEISQVLTSPVRIEDALTSAMACLGRHFGLRHCLVVLFEERHMPQLLVGGGGVVAAKAYFNRLAQPAISRITSSHHPVLVPDVAADPLFTGLVFRPAAGPVSFVGVPILSHGQVIGTLTAEKCAADVDTEALAADARFLSMVAKLIGQTHHLHLLIARDRERLMDENRREQKRIESKQQALSRVHGIAGIVGESQAVREALRQIHIVARSQLPILLRGESGTVKELFAKAVHDLSSRRHGPMVKLNCAALPETMLESELFGHEQGAFTGATGSRRGRFELANGGTLFLDEIGEISAGFQAKLLRVLQEGEFERVGGSETVKVDVRVVAATNRNLEDDVRKGTFRSDLYFRLCVVPIVLAPLRERKEDIPLLAIEFLRRFNAANGTNLTFTEDAVQLMQGCPFPGNIRELESCVRRTAAFAHGCEISHHDFACQQGNCLSSLLWKGQAEPLQARVASPLPVVPLPENPVESRASAAGVSTGRAATHEFGTPPPGYPAAPPMAGGADAVLPSAPDGADPGERTLLLEAMEKAGWVQAKAARLLGISARQMGYALRKHGIEIKHF
jgi:Nif-specific regulatory protein